MSIDREYGECIKPTTVRLLLVAACLGPVSTAVKAEPPAKDVKVYILDTGWLECDANWMVAMSVVGTKAHPIRMKSPIHVEMKPARPAPVIPSRGIPKRPKIRMRQSTIFIAFMTRALTI